MTPERQARIKKMVDDGARPSDIAYELQLSTETVTKAVYRPNLGGRELRLRRVGAAAKRIGLTAEQYLGRVEVGEKWCPLGQHWTAKEAFGRDAGRADELSQNCKPCGAAKRRK